LSLDCESSALPGEQHHLASPARRMNTLGDLLMTRRTHVTAAAFASVALVAAVAVAGATSPANAATKGDAAGLARAKAQLATWGKPNDKIGPTVPLKSKPPKKTIYWFEAEAASSKAITPGLRDGAALLGWDLKVGQIKAFDPAQAFQQAIDAKADYIAISGTPYALYEAQAKEAEKKGIKVVSCYAAGPENAPGAGRNLLNQCGDENFVTKTGPAMANWMTVDSKGLANVLIVNWPDYPVLLEEENAFRAELKKNCSKCVASTLKFTLDDFVGGKIPNMVASRLQANKKINYVFFTFGDSPAGVTATLKSANLLKRVKVFGQDFNKADLEEIVNGTMGAWSANPKAYAGWLMVDAAARHAVGQENTEERKVAALPSYIVSSPAEAKKVLALPESDWNPAGMADQFKKLWGN
jgi:ribose transport system substrate-binding protein